MNGKALLSMEIEIALYKYTVELELELKKVAFLATFTLLWTCCFPTQSTPVIKFK